MRIVIVLLECKVEGDRTDIAGILPSSGVTVSLLNVRS